MGFSAKKIEVDSINLNNLVNDFTENLEDKIVVPLKAETESLDLSNVAANISLFGEKYYGHKDFETLEELELKKKENLEDIGNFSSLKVLSLDNCDLENSSDLKLIPDTMEAIDISNSEISNYSYLNDKSNLTDISIYWSDNGIDFDQFQNGKVTHFTLNCAKGDVTGDLSGMSSLKTVSINNTDLDSVDCLKYNYNLEHVDLDNNLLSDISPLYGSNIDSLSIQYNSIQELDLYRLPNLTHLYIKGNYALYTQEIFDYCKYHNISIDIEQKDIDEMNQVREIVEGLNLEGKTDLEKEKIIYQYVIDHMDYKLSKVIDSNEEPIKNALDGVGVCYGYAVFFKALCNAAGLNVYLDEGFGKTFPFGGPHAWNLVEIEGQYYLCDPTWSDAVRESWMDPRYRIKRFWYEHFKKEDLPPDDKFSNVYGKDAKKFIKKHRENPWGERKDIMYRDDKALDIVSVDTSEVDGQNVAIDTAIASTNPRVSGIKKISSELVEKLTFSYK